MAVNIYLLEEKSNSTVIKSEVVVIAMIVTTRTFTTGPMDLSGVL